MAIDWLIEKPQFRSRHFELNLGARSGYDILSDDDPNDVIVAEVFASRNPKYNKKLESDVNKVRNYPNAKHRYVFALVPDKKMLEQVRTGVFIQGFDPNDFQQWAKRINT
jgi:hypothetical protein